MPAKNDITQATIQTAPTNSNYQKGWEKIFGRATPAKWFEETQEGEFDESWPDQEISYSEYRKLIE